MSYRTARNDNLRRAGDSPPGDRQPSGELTKPATPGRQSAANADIAKLSHDIRTQLYIIIGFAELMLEEVPGKINEEQRRNLNDVLRSGKRLQGLLTDIVEPSKNKRQP